MYRERTIILGRVLLMLRVCSREQKKCEERTKEAKEKKQRRKQQTEREKLCPRKKEEQKTRQKFTLFLSRPIGGVGVLQ